MHRIKSSFPLFETAIIAILAGVGWALYLVYGGVEDLGRQRLEPPPRPESRQVLHVTSLVELRDQYLLMADRVDQGMQLLRSGLDAFVQDRTVSLGQYLREADMLQRRLVEIVARAESRDLSGLRAELATNEVLRLENNLAADLLRGALLTNLVHAVSNYVATLNITETQPLTPDIVQRKVARARDAEGAVAALTMEARQRAGRIEAMLGRRAVELVSPPVPAGQSARLAERQRGLELILRLLAAVFLVLAAVLVAAVYRRIVVFPLHQRIIEHATSAEFQRKLDHFARLASGLAHEIRNPLTAINIRLFTLQKSLTAGSSQHADTVLIRNEIDRLEQILKDFLRLARPSEPKLVPITARPLLDETRNLLSEQCRRRGVELRVDKETMAESPFLGDSVQLKQVLINLVQNASESIVGRGRVTLRAYENRGDNGANPQRRVVLEVEDTGPGIAPDVQERLFDPFFSTKDNGTGLGLPIAAKIVDQHKGRLEFETRAERGTTFRVILPVDGQRDTNA